MDSLLSPVQAFSWGFEVSEVALKRASARIRAHLSQDITSGTSTITARGPAFRLPQRPVVEVSSVVDSDGATVAFTLAGSVLTVDSLDVVTVAYSHGYATIPDALAELTCQIASRLEATPQDSALAQGVQTQAAGGFSVGYGWDAWKAQAGLTQGEKDALNRIWPPLPRVIVMGAPAS